MNMILKKACLSDNEAEVNLIRFSMTQNPWEARIKQKTSKQSRRR